MIAANGLGCLVPDRYALAALHCLTFDLAFRSSATNDGDLNLAAHSKFRYFFIFREECWVVNC